MITRKKGTKKARDNDGIYKKECGCLIHEPNDTILINIKKGKKITSATLSRFYDLKLLSKKASYICRQCKDNVSKNNLSSNQCLEVPCLNNVTYSDVVSETLADVHPHTIKEKIDEDVNVLFKEKFCSSAENLRTYDPVKWMNERPKDLLDICNMNENDDQTAIWINKCIEQIYSVRHKRLVLPLAFKQNLLTYSLSNSKLLLNLTDAQELVDHIHN